MKLYYSHDESTYGTLQESTDLDMMGSLGINVLNPNAPTYQERVRILRECSRENEIPAFLCSLIDKCEGVIFRALPDGTLSEQIQLEVTKAKDDRKPILQVPDLETKEEVPA